MKKIKGLFIQTAIGALLIGALLIGCQRDLLKTTNKGHIGSLLLGSGSYSLFTTQLPTNVYPDLPVELGMKFQSVTAGTITAFRFYKVAGDTGVHKGHLWTAGGTLLRSATFTAETDTGWQTVTLDTAVHIGSDTTYVVSVNAPVKYGATGRGLYSVVNNGPLSSVADGNNGVYIYTPGAFPTNSYNSANYFRDVVFVPTVDDASPPTAPGSLTASSITSSSVHLSWTASTDNIGVTGYEVYRNGVLVDTLSGTSINESHLNAFSPYSFYVLARDAFGNRSVASNLADFTTSNPGTLTHGSQLDTTMVGPQAIGITSFTTVAGGTFYGAALSGWGSLARTVAAGGETIDGFWFPQGTVVLQGANISSLITVATGWLVLRGCTNGGVLVANPLGDNGGAAALYSTMWTFSTNGRKDNDQPLETIVHRCYFPHNGLENIYADNVTVTENWITPDGGAVGEHVDAIQTWGGQYYLNISRNHLQFNAPDPNGTFSGLCGIYTDGSQAGFAGFDHLTVNNNYFVLDSTGNALHAPLGQPVTNATITGNTWVWNGAAPDKDHTGAVYVNVSLTIPNYKTNGNTWSNNTWATGPYSGQYLLPNDNTSSTDY